MYSCSHALCGSYNGGYKNSEEIEIKVGVKAILKTAFSLKQGSPDVVIVLKNKQF